MSNETINRKPKVKTIENETLTMMQAFGGHHIVNLGHGVYPDTPLDGVRAFVQAVKG